MKVSVSFLGPLGLAIGREKVDFELPDGSTYGDLLQNIGARFGGMFPHGMWDMEMNAFKRGVLTVGLGRDLDDPATLLKENEPIKFVPLLIGG